MAHNIPQRVGRYEVVGRLALGGMAEILLGRLTGPSGFERPVVIKRILPQRAQDPAFVDMFLDEARIAAGIRHPNVVQHEELGRDGDDLFLVMEYLEGESVASVLRRARARDQSLDLALAAHIVGEACAGLHAAHELEGADGLPQNLVHRDVSPHNIFVTYTGSVKVLDFGIAKAADRITQTEAGTLKGKFEYMSPEQAKSRPLDRRSDVFALGIVLYELTTARSLFRKETQVGTLRAVMDHPIKPPSAFVDGYPKELERVCLRALERHPAKRYPTALDMRRDLLAAARKLPSEGLAEEGLSALMTLLFSTRIEEKRDLLRRVREGASIRQIPEPEVDVFVEIPRIEIGDVPSLAATTPAGSSDQVRSRPPRLWAWVAAVALLLVLAGGAFVAFRATGGETQSRGGDQQSASVVPVGAVSPNMEAGPPSADVGAVLTKEARSVTLVVESEPDRAEVFWGSERKGHTPLRLDIKRDKSPIILTIQKAGFVSVEEKVVPEMDQRIRVHLKEARRKAGRSKSASAGSDAQKTTESPEKGRTFRRFD